MTQPGMDVNLEREREEERREKESSTEFVCNADLPKSGRTGRVIPTSRQIFQAENFKSLYPSVI